MLHTIAVLLLSAFCLPPSAFAQFTAAEAKDHVGERATVCGEVVTATFARRSRNTPTFLNLDKPYPDHIFTIIVWRRDATNLLGRRVCATGRIALYRGRPQISSPSRLAITPAPRQ
jgi:hypothetical protein